ncbi:MAG: flagellar motor switch protein FliM [Provencibacterium sp.]|jgi:flagellar motor switch protein FliM|nr:flagellar motor switch protein FliM [Provencibacterium sp.]
MPEKLSQAQIDALLNRMNSGEEVEKEDESKKLKEYDFRSPKKFTKEQLRTMDSLHENFSRLLSSHLSGILRMFCEVSVLQIEEMTYFEYNNALPDSALIAMIDFKPENKHYSEGTLIMDISTSVGFFMIDRLLGGTGDNSNLSRDYTDIEMAILENMLHKIVNQLQDAWHNYLDVSIGLGSVETNSRLLQAFAPEDIVVIVALQIKIKDLTGNLSICIPAENLEEVIDNFSMKYTRTAKRQALDNEEAKKQIIFNTITDSNLEIKAVLGELSLDLRDILQLQVSDVIPLNKSIDSDIEVWIDDAPWFNAKLGEAKSKKAVKLGNLIS